MGKERNNSVTVRRATPEKMDELLASLDSVFRPSLKPGTGMYNEFPHLFSRENARNTYYIEMDGKPVSQASVFKSTGYINGAWLKVASLGSVSTLPDYRHRGFSTTIIRRILKDLKREKFSLLLVSGEIELYTRLECIKTGSRLFGVTMKKGYQSIHQIRSVETGDRIKTAGKYLKLYTSEPYRRFRTLKQMEILLDSLWFKRNNYRMEMLEALNKNEIVAYVVAFRKGESDEAVCMEYAGSRSAVMEMLLQINQRFGTERTKFYVHPDDFTMIDLSVENGITLTKQREQGTIRVIDPEELFSELRMTFVEKLGYSPLLENYGRERWMVRMHNRKIRIDGIGNLTRLIFDAPPEGFGIPIFFTDDLNYI